MSEVQNIGRKIIDIGPLVDLFEAQEGEIQQIIGKTGNGKTYEATRRAIEYLEQGYTVYTTWHLILPDYYDQREDKAIVFFKTVLFKSNFYKFDYKKNWHHLDVDREDLIQFVAGLTDCIVMLDEGQDIFDSRERINKPTRKTLTRTRHMRKTLIIISQRAQAVEVTARANVTYFYKCVKTRAWYWPFRDYFKVYRTEEMDQQNFPIWEDSINDWQAELWRSHFARNKVFNAYDSWYLRQGIPRSQDFVFEAYKLNFFQKIRLLLTPIKKAKIIAPSEETIDKIKEMNLKKYREATLIPEKKKRKKLSTGQAQGVDNSIPGSSAVVKLGYEEQRSENGESKVWPTQEVQEKGTSGEPLYPKDIIREK